MPGCTPSTGRHPPASAARKTRHHEGGHGGDVERVAAVAPCAAGIEQGLALVEAGVDGDGHAPHGTRETDQFVDRFALHFEGGQKGGDLRLAGLAAQNNMHRSFRVGGRQTLCGDEEIQVRQKRHDILGFL